MLVPGVVLLDRVASGGVATIYLARDASSGERVAVKHAHGALLEHESFREQLRREAAFTRGFAHPNVVSARAIHESDTEVWLVMDYVEGASVAELRDTTPTAPMPVGVAARIVLDACLGLAAVHDEGRSIAPLGLVHRDVSPENLLVGTDGITRIADFGAARPNERPSRVVRGGPRGTFAHMAPEDIEECAVDLRADVFAIAIVAWELVVGSRLFHDSRGELASMRAVLEDEAPRPSDRRPALGTTLDAVFRDALAKTAGARTESITRFAAAFERAILAAGIAIATHDDVAHEVQTRIDDETLIRRRGASRDGEGGPPSSTR